MSLRGLWWLALLVVLTVLAGACSSKSAPVGGGSAEVVASTSSALTAADVTSVVVMITAPDIPTPIVQNLTLTGGSWRGTIGGIPVGPGRTFSALAFNAAGAVIFATPATPPIVADITAGGTAAVILTLQQTAAPSPFFNAAPVIDSIVASTTNAAEGASVAIAVTAHDPDPGDTIQYAWTANGGSFANASAATTSWIAPATDGSYSLTISVSDTHGASAGMSFVVNVAAGNAQGSSGLTVTFNMAPVISMVTAAPTSIDVGQTTLASVTATDPDGNPLSYVWSASCSGAFASPNAASTAFTLGAVGSPSCALHVDVSDGLGGTNNGTIVIATGPAAAFDVAPQILTTFQSSPTSIGNDVLSFSAIASDPENNPLTFAWTTNVGTLGVQTDSAGGAPPGFGDAGVPPPPGPDGGAPPPSTTTQTTSQITWTAPPCFTAGVTPTITLTVTESTGPSTSFAFAVAPAPTALCGAATLTVTTTADSGPGSLRDVIASAPSGSTVVFAPSLSGQTIGLLAPIAFSTPVAIQGPGSSQLTISGGGTHQIFSVNAATVSGLRLTNGFSLSAGGAIAAHSIVLTDVVFESNRCNGTPVCLGGALHVDLSATLDHVIFKNNSATQFGGACSLRGATTAMNDVQFFSNGTGSVGGALAITGGGPTTVTNAVFAGNGAPSGGAGVYVAGASLDVTNATFRDNTDGIQAEQAAVTLVNTTFSDNVVAAISINQTSPVGGSFTTRFSNFFNNGAFATTADPRGANGNIGLDPLFVDTTSPTAALWDLHLQPTSPLVHAGDPAISNRDGGRSDIGYYGGPGAPASRLRFSGMTGSTWQSRVPDALGSTGMSDYSPPGADGFYLLNSAGTFSHYSASADTWTLLTPPSIQLTPYIGSAWMGSSLYHFRNGQLHRYDIPSNVWSAVSGNPLPLADANAFPGVFQTTRGLTTHDDAGNILAFSEDGSQHVLRFSTTTTSFVIAPTTIAEPAQDPLVGWDPATHLLFVAPSFELGALYAVDPISGATTPRTRQPEGFMNHPFCSDRSGHLYAAGYWFNARTFWQYDTAADTWRRLPDLPFDKGLNGGCTVTDDGWLYVAPGDTNNLARLQLF